MVLAIPVRQPFNVVRKLHFLSPKYLVLFNISVVKAPPLAAMTVFVTATATAAPSPSPDMEPWEEPLNAKKPKTRMKPPREAN